MKIYYGKDEVPMSQFISQLAENYPVSGIRRMFDLAAGKQDIVNLCNGEPNFDTPENIKQAAIRSIEANQTRYAPAFPRSVKRSQRNIPDSSDAPSRSRMLWQLQAVWKVSSFPL